MGPMIKQHIQENGNRGAGIGVPAAANEGKSRTESTQGKKKATRLYLDRTKVGMLFWEVPFVRRVSISFHCFCVLCSHSPIFIVNITAQIFLHFFYFLICYNLFQLHLFHRFNKSTS